MLYLKAKLSLQSLCMVMCVCTHTCVCMCERERDRDKDRGRDKRQRDPLFYLFSCWAFGHFPIGVLYVYNNHTCAQSFILFQNGITRPVLCTRFLTHIERMPQLIHIYISQPCPSLSILPKLHQTGIVFKKYFDR